MIPLFVVIPLASAFVISLVGKFIKWFSDIVSNLATLVLVILSFVLLSKLNSVYPAVLTYKVGGWVPPVGILLAVDHLSVMMLLTVNIVALCATIFSISYMEKYTDKWKYYSLFMLMLAGMNGVIITGDMFNMYVFLEIAAISSYALVAFGCEAEELEASFKYLVLGSVGSAFILLSIALTYSYVSSLNLADIANTLKRLPQGNIVKFVVLLFVVGFGIKAALVPFHSWLPDAHPSAPAPISAMLSGVLIKTLGIYAMVRIIINIIGTSSIGVNILQIFVILGLISMIVGVILALYQWDYKRLLAYHSISQVGYIILGIGLGTPLGILGGLFHLVNHSIFKSLLFLTSGAIEYTIGTRDLRKMGELKEKMPITASFALVGSMSISGIPPFNGFWSKLIIILACIQAGRLWAGFFAAVVSFLTLSSFLKVQKYAFFGKADVKYNNIKEVPIFMTAGMLILSVLCIILGILVYPQVKQVFLDKVVEVVISGKDYAIKVFNSL